MTLAAWLPATLGAIANLLAGVALMGVGVWLLTLDRRTLATRYLATFLVSYGAYTFLTSLRAPPSLGLALFIAAVPALIHSSIAVLLLVFVFPRPVRPWLSDSFLFLAPAAAALVVAISRSFLEPSDYLAVAVGLSNVLGGFAILFASVRLLRTPPGAERRSLAILVFAGLLLTAHFVTLNVIAGIVGEPGPLDRAVRTLSSAVSAAIILLTVGVLARAAPRQQAARVALAVTLLGSVSGALAVLFREISWLQTSGWWRLAYALLVAWGILRHQFLGMDVRVRWTISKSTIAAAFIAVFFVASETAQQFFGETLESTYLGIATAGMLVFAIAPLQRLAERFAETAVPVPGASPARPEPERESIYRDALRLALRDRRVTRAEEAQLHRLAEALGIRPARAHEMLAEVEADTTPDVG